MWTSGEGCPAMKGKAREGYINVEVRGGLSCNEGEGKRRIY